MTGREAHREDAARPRSQRQHNTAARSDGRDHATEGPLDSRRAVSHLQRAAGNAAVTSLLQEGADAALQRVAVTVPTRRETLFNQRSRGKATSEVYGDASGSKFDMARGGTPEAVTVTVRIRFVDQARDADGADTGAVTAIPAGDERREWATAMCASAPALWTGKATLVGTRAPKPRNTWDGIMNPDPGGPVRLPLVFKAVPVFELASPAAPADTTVALFGSGTTAGGDQHPIDAGHYYMDKGDYPFPAEAIYAHEYGHLIGLSDEYSQSNPQMHALLHSIDPGTSAARGKAMDTETVRRMVVAALTRPLFNRLHAATREISSTLSRGSKPLRQVVGGQLRAALADPGVRSMFAVTMPPTSAALVPRVPPLVDAAAGAARNTTDVAASVVATELAPRALGALVDARHFAALDAVHGAADVGGIGMNITVEGNAGITSDGEAVIPPSGVWKAAAAGAMRRNARRVADRVIGASQERGKLPPVRPPATLISTLKALPASWTALTAGVPAALSSGTIQANLITSLTAAWLARLGTVAPTVRRTRALAAAVERAVHAAARATTTNAVRAYLTASLDPLMTTSVSGLMTAIGTEVTSLLATPAGATAAAAPKDPQLAAMAAALNTRLRAEITAAKTAQAATQGSTSVDPGAGAPGQSVTYGTVNMMSDNTAVFRVDQFAALAAQFNAPANRLMKEREAAFTVEKV